MVDPAQLDNVEFSLEAASRGVSNLRDEPTPGNVEVVVANLYRAIQEVQALNVASPELNVASVLSTRLG